MNAASSSHHHDYLRTTKSAPHSSQYGGEPVACKESCNSTLAMTVRFVCSPLLLAICIDSLVIYTLTSMSECSENE